MLSTDFVTGSPNWLDLGSPDTAGSAEFYGRVFGWDVQSAGPDTGGYAFFQQDGKDVAALGPLTEEGASPAWTVYFQTPDADATAKAAEQAGGRVRVPPADVMDAGRLACLTDPGGAEFSLWQPGAVKGLERMCEPDTLLWVELHTADPASAAAFYRSLFGWGAEEREFSTGMYTLISTAGSSGPDAPFGGIAPVPGEGEGDGDGMESRWIPYFLVTDTDATVTKAQESGGSVVAPAADVPDVGRIAWLADQFGAVFGVIKPLPREA
ncbi:VOC family protein [Streptomyces roseifaciens]|uniref:VOC family protein n=1 Tax=Streptomyces roseifaciens TaxID=1488406 RepID=UPI0007181861|nr:VOC family protein [Streptomyces roseifaciens]